MKVDILEYSGFCKGVMKAIQKLDNLIEENPNKTIYLLGAIVHNDKVIEKYSKLNVKIIDENDLDNLNEDSIIISSAHGISKRLREKLSKFNHIDTTCPFVKRNQDIISNIKNKEIIFIGKKGHAESVALTEGIPNLKFVENIEDLNKSNNEGVCYNQTTLNEEKLNKIHEEMKKRYPYYSINNTLCETTKKIQDFLRTKNNKYDALIVVGSKTSSNANSLVSLSKYEKTFFINDEKELETLDFKGVNNLIIIGSASTPKDILQKVKSKCEDLKN